jgi:hypothetical protein
MMLCFRQFLIETQTVAQYLRAAQLNPVSKQKLDDIRGAAEHVVSQHGFGPKVKQILTNYLTAVGMSEPYKHIFTISNKFSQYMSKWADFIAAQQNNGSLLSKLNTIDFTPQMLTQASEDWHQELSMRNRGAGPEGKTVLALDHIGWKGWKWVSLDRGYCREEGRSGGHCGNVGARPGDNILSLRDPANYVHLTFIVNSGLLGESKGRANSKPSPKYHPPIIELLKSPLIKSIRGGGYAPEQNFHLRDLPPVMQEEIKKLKPSIDFTDFALKSHSPKLLGDLLNTKVVRASKNIVILEEFNDWKSLYDSIKSNDVEDFSWLEDPFDFVSSDYVPPMSDLIDYVDDDNKEKLAAYLKVNGDELLDAAGDNSDIEEILTHAYHDGEAHGTEAEAYKHVRSELGSPTDNGFYIDFDHHPWSLKIDKSSLYKILNGDQRYDIDNSGLLSLLDFQYSQPYNGYHEFDINAFNERLKELMSELPDPTEVIGQEKFDFAR